MYFNPDNLQDVFSRVRGELELFFKEKGPWGLSMAFYFDGTKDPLWGKASFVWANSFIERHGLAFEKFKVEPAQLHKGGLKSNNSYTWRKNNVSRLKTLLESGNIKSIDLYCKKNRDHFLISDEVFFLQVKTGFADSFAGLIYLQVNPELLGNSRPKQIAELRKIVETFEKIVNICYGYVQPMAYGKSPLSFATGGIGVHSTAAEILDAFSWNKFKGSYDWKVRNLYWGNFITSKHCRKPFRESIAEVNRLVLPENVYHVSEDKIFFTLPIELAQVEDKEKCKYYQELRSQFISIFEFMVPQVSKKELESIPTGMDLLVGTIAKYIDEP